MTDLNAFLANLFKKRPVTAATAPSDEEAGGWVSWDPHPWKHPWLTTENLKKAADFSEEFLSREKQALENIDPLELSVGFVGNIANSMYVRAVPLRRAGLDISLYLHPQDTFVMSYPEWEEADLIVSDDGVTIETLRNRHDLPIIAGVHQIPGRDDWKKAIRHKDTRFLRPEDRKAFDKYLYYVDTLKALQKEDVLWGTQCLYLAYLANKPYVVSQSGGDAWFETARGDMLGALVRQSFAQARIWLVTNPWSFAHARRMGLNNLIYLPKIIDEDVYAPGRGRSVTEWKQQVGGDFFVLTTSRLDDRNKGLSIGIEGFADFAKAYDQARLVMIGWGKDKERTLSTLQDLGIAERTILLPMSSKGRLRDYLRSADVFIDQFVLGYFGSAGMEAMASGLPMIGRLELDQYAALAETGAPPVLNAETPAAVRAHLEHLIQSADTRRTVSQDHRTWFLENHGSRRWLKDHEAVLAATAAGLPVDFSESPLSAPLSPAELRYHEDGLAEAPPFPNYGW